MSQVLNVIMVEIEKHAALLAVKEMDIVIVCNANDYIYSINGDLYDSKDEDMSPIAFHYRRKMLIENGGGEYKFTYHR